tara:strand:- start:4900 stop:5232 length:333 start_codon:yes stop_codon:yes gene_type:complete
MISRGALVWLFAAIVLGGAMIVIKARVQSLEEELAGLKAGIRAEERAVHVLKAEWSYLNQPVKLRQLTERYLGLTEMTTEQIVRLEDLPMRPVPEPEAGPGQTLNEEILP